MPGRPAPLETRFWEKVDVRGPDECWPWTAHTTKGHGYIRISASEGKIPAHRLSYTIAFGTPPAHLDVDHTCHNTDPTCAGGDDCVHRRCVNPAHLEAVTRRENLLRGKTSPAANVAKERCPQGHPYSGDNLYTHGTHRLCRTCRLAANRRWNARKAAA